MQQISNFGNVIYDSNSRTKFDNLNERDFLIELFAALKFELKDQFKDYFFYVFSTNDTSVLPAIADQNIDVNRSVLFYLSDETSFIPENLSPFFKVIFKSYLPYEPGGNIHSFTLGHINDMIFAADSVLPVEKRTINLFFSGNLQKNRSDLYRQFNMLRAVPLTLLTRMLRGPLRNIFLKLFGSDFSSEEKKFKIQFTNGFMKGYSKKEYKDFLLQTKILLCPKGSLSVETFRLFEGLNAGCIVISEMLPELDIYKDVPVIQIKSWDKGLKKAREFLSDPLMLQGMQDESIKWWNSNCSYSSVAKRIIIQLQK
jgi:hypothetical protein